MDKHKIDSQKLSLHPQSVCNWLDGKDVFPIYGEIGPSGRCNHRCIFCAFDYLNYEGSFINLSNERLSELSSAGVKAIMYAGEGEPLLHPEIVRLVTKAKGYGIDIAITSNGVLFAKEKMQAILPSLSWIKFSVDAAYAETHSKIHGCKSKDFELLCRNIQEAVKFRNASRCKCVIGYQMLLIPENYNEMFDAATIAKFMGVDYFVVKPFTKHPLSSIDEEMDYSGSVPMEKEVLALADDKFDVIIRHNAMHKTYSEKTYTECFGYRFWIYIDCNGDVYSCSAFLGDKRYCFGNINEQSLKEIWNGNRRKEVIARMSQVDVNTCRKLCRLDEVNQYLWELKHPPAHVNFL